MALTRDQIEALASAPNVKEFMIKSLGDTVYMRQPSMAEWRLISEHHQADIGKDGDELASDSSMAEVLGTLLSDNHGKRLYDRFEEEKILRAYNHEVFLEIYQIAWAEILSVNQGDKAKKG